MMLYDLPFIFAGRSGGPGRRSDGRRIGRFGLVQRRRLPHPLGELFSHFATVAEEGLGGRLKLLGDGERGRRRTSGGASALRFAATCKTGEGRKLVVGRYAVPRRHDVRHRICVLGGGRARRQWRGGRDGNALLATKTRGRATLTTCATHRLACRNRSRAIIIVVVVVPTSIRFLLRFLAVRFTTARSARGSLHNDVLARYCGRVVVQRLFLLDGLLAVRVTTTRSAGGSPRNDGLTVAALARYRRSAAARR